MFEEENGPADPDPDALDPTLIPLVQALARMATRRSRQGLGAHT